MRHTPRLHDNHGGFFRGLYGFVRRWRALLVAVLAGLLLIWSDARLKSTSLEGYCPENSDWVFAAEDFGRFWEALQKTERLRSVAQALSRPLAHLERVVRRTTGIRPAPLRWNTWLGPRLILASADGVTGMCVRPGLLLRAAAIADRCRPHGARADRLGRFRSLSYGWRDGFLIVSQSADYVRASLAAPVPPLALSRGRDEARFFVRTPVEATVRLRALDSLPIEASFTAPVALEHGALLLTNPWPKLPCISVAAAHSASLAQLIKTLQPALSRSPFCTAVSLLFSDLRERWRVGALPEGWDVGIEEWSVALTGLDTQESLPVPEAALILSGLPGPAARHPLEPLFLGGPVLPMAWNGEPGVLVPWWGEKLSWCLGRSGAHWLLTTQEPLMASLAESLREGPEVPADLALRVNWREVSRAAQALLPRAADLELIPRANSEDIRRDWMPVVDAVSDMGRCEVLGRFEDGRVILKGFLAAQAPEETP